MHVRHFNFRVTCPSLLFLASIGAAGAFGCSDAEPGTMNGSGGATGEASGGMSSSGGSASGGATGSGGAASGGAAASGGETNSGGASGGMDTVGSGGADGSGGAAETGEFTLTSAELVEGAEFMDAHTCASGDFMNAPAPSFAWSGVPEGTQSFAMVMIDKTLVDMGDSLGYHSAFWNLPASVTSLPEAFKPADLSGAQVINKGYLGPCPKLGNVPTPHTYVFTLYALPEPTITLGNTLNAAFIQTLEDAALGTATLSGESSAALP